MAMHRDKHQAKLSELRVLGLKGRDLLQELILDGFDHFSNHENSTRLTAAFEVCMEVKSWRNDTIRDYIVDHADVRWSKTKKQFLKDGEGRVTAPTVPWYEYKNSVVAAVFDWNKSRKSSLRKAIKHYKKGMLKDNKDNCQKESIEREAKLLGIKLTPDWDKEKDIVGDDGTVLGTVEQVEETKSAAIFTATA